MDEFIFALNSVIPLFLMVMVGSTAGHAGWIKKEHIPILNKICFNIFIPCMMIKSAMSADFSKITDSWIYLYGMLSIPLATFVMYLVVPHFIKENEKTAAFIHSAFRSNTMLLTFPLAIRLLGEQGAFPITLMLVLAAPVNNSCAITVLTLLCGREEKISVKGFLYALVVNPVFLGMIAGLVIYAFNIELPDVIMSPISSFSSAATPLAMLSIGANFKLKKLSTDIKVVTACAAIKLLILPIVFSLPLVLLHRSAMAIMTIFMLHAAPTAATSSIMTSVMGGDGDLADETILFSTAVSLITLSVAIAAGRSMGFL